NLLMASQNLSSIAISSTVLDNSTSVASCNSPSMDHFFATPLKSPGYFSAKCRYCLKQFSRGRSIDLEVHLAKECEDESLDDEIRGKYIEIFINILKSLRSSYIPPTREYLANTLLNKEVIKINWETEEYLQTADNLTL
ncbi:19325_t:CDS:2, partial [Gigaspora rosea]